MSKRQQYTTSRFGAMSPDEAKGLVRDGLLVMTIAERVDFIRALADELRRESITMSAYLIPLGISGTSPEELTPTEVGHLVRFLKINLPRSVRAVERALTRYTAFEQRLSAGRIAA